MDRGGRAALSDTRDDPESYRRRVQREGAPRPGGESPADVAARVILRWGLAAGYRRADSHRRSHVGGPPRCATRWRSMDDPRRSPCSRADSSRWIGRAPCDRTPRLLRWGRRDCDPRAPVQLSSGRCPFRADLIRPRHHRDIRLRGSSIEHLAEVDRALAEVPGEPYEVAIHRPTGSSTGTPPCRSDRGAALSEALSAIGQCRD